MANSITASTVSPFSGLLLSDANYVATASFTAAATSSTPALFFPNLQYPTTGKFIIQVATINTTVSTGSVNIVLQESSDGTTWNNIATNANPLIATSGSVASASVQVSLDPAAKSYLRANAISIGALPTGSVTLTALF